MWHDSQGNATIAVVGATAACMIIALIFISITGIYVSNQSADTAAAAAALGALRSLRDPMLNTAENETAKKIQEFWAAVNQAVSIRLAQWEVSYASSRRSSLKKVVPPIPEQEIEEIIAEEIDDLLPYKAEDFRRSEVMSRKPAIAWELLAGIPLPLEVKVREFLTAKERGCLIYQVARSNQGAMESAAGNYAASNGTFLESVKFTTTSRLEVEAKAKERINLALFDELLPPERRYLIMAGNAYLDNLVGQPVEFPTGCRKE